MRIAFVTERLLVGFGVDLVIDQVASRLQASGHDVVVYAAQVDERARTGAYRVERLGVEAARLYPLYEWRARRWASLIDAGDHDVVFVETFPFFSIIPLLKTPAVAVDHGISSTEGMSLPRRAMFGYVSLSQYRRWLRRARAIVTVSEFLRDELPQPLRERCTVIYNGADHYELGDDEARRRIRGELGIGDDEVLTLYVGRLNPERQPYKGTADLLRFAPRWRAAGVRLVLAGRAEPGDQRRITDAGAIAVTEPSAAHLAGLYAAADVYVTASRWEGFDLPLAEAAFAGVPGIALRVGAHPEVSDGILVDDPVEIEHAVLRIAGDREERERLGEAAARVARERFTWDRAAEQYAELAAKIAPARRPEAVAQASSDVTAVVLNYGAPYDILERCLASIRAQTHRTEAILVDNGSPKNRDVLDRVAGEFPEVRQLRLKQNLGFAGGMNRGIADVRTPYVLLLNNDTQMDRNAVLEMRRVVLQDDSLAGVAPKLLFANDPDVFDAVGNLVTEDGSAFNMGIGQIDVGQYDRSERTFGACFAAALVRTHLFRDGVVGPLDERYFMYYEDIDWCYRANVMGYGFATAPDARVLHEHSYSSRELEYAFKYRLIERNFVRTVIKDFERGRAVRFALKRTAVQLRNALKGVYPRESIRVMFELLPALPWLVKERTRIQARRRVSDVEIIAYSRGERPAFDPQRYAPERGAGTIELMYRRRYLLNGSERDKNIAETAAALTRYRAGASAEQIRERLLPLLKDEPARVLQLLDDR